MTKRRERLGMSSMPLMRTDAKTATLTSPTLAESAGAAEADWALAAKTPADFSDRLRVIQGQWARVVSVCGGFENLPVSQT